MRAAKDRFQPMSDARKINWKQILGVVKYVYTPLIVACIFYFLFTNRILLVELFANAKLTYLISAVMVWASLHFISPVSSQLVLRSLGYSLPYRDLLKIYITRLLARYLPGGVWHTVGRLADYRSFGVTKKHLTLVFVFETVFPIPGTFFLGGVFLWISSPGTIPKSLVMTFTVVSFIVLIGPLFFLTRSILKKYFSERVFFYYFTLLLLLLFFWFLAACSFVLYYNATMLGEVAQHSFSSLAGAYIFSWGTGYISFFAPQGIGVFEVVAGKLIDLPMTFGSTVAFLAGFRLVALFADFLVCSFLLLIPFFYKNDRSNSL